MKNKCMFQHMELQNFIRNMIILVGLLICALWSVCKYTMNFLFKFSLRFEGNTTLLIFLKIIKSMEFL